ncbi:transposable element Tcb1 transposase [Trichonephila clavipes]|nr:transposable element Tcb1 transposase [Trichonephila clavipes]
MFAQEHQNLAEHRSFRTMTDDTPVNSEMEMFARISITGATTRETPGIFRTCLLIYATSVSGHIVMKRRLETSISETARLVGCSRSTVVSTYAKWMNDGETSSRRHGVGRPHAIKEKGRRRLS